MRRWLVIDLMQLYDAARAAGLNTFLVRRTLQRLERAEIDVPEAVRTIREGRTGK